VTATAYNVLSLPTSLTLGSADSDSFNLDSNTGRMTQYNFSVNGKSLVGNLGWNANGTLGTLGITDALNSADTQSCTYGYDDLGRISKANCGSIWNETFNFDSLIGYGAFGNLVKNGISGATSFQPSYNLSTNQVNSWGVTYDANGNLTYDSLQSYSWDADGNSVGVGSATLTFDALDRAVEMYKGGNYTQFVYSPLGGKLALMNGQTLSKAFVPLPAGGAAVYNSSGLQYYRHPDWLGSSRLASTPGRGVYYDGAYAPYGENYAETGTTDRNFTGQNQDIVSSGGYPLYDFLMREYHPTWGRWLSPDPADLGAVDPTDPQTWNQYGYVRNSPLNFVDPLGLVTVPCGLMPCGGAGQGCDPDLDPNCPPPPCGPGLGPFQDPFCGFPPLGGGGGGGAGGTGGTGSIPANSGFPGSTTVPNAQVCVTIGGTMACTISITVEEAVEGGLLAAICAGSGVCEAAIGIGAVAGAGYLLYKALPTTNQMAKGGTQNVGHDYVREEARQLAKELKISYCEALQLIYEAARYAGNFKKANDTKATQKQDGCRGH
jgi:RHS repeat-associated protein